MHALRRNVDLNILLFNNEIYGLTKGQYSPTSRVGTRSPSTPLGSVDRPVSALSFALGAGARFVARAIDTRPEAHARRPEARARPPAALASSRSSRTASSTTTARSTISPRRTWRPTSRSGSSTASRCIFGKDRKRGIRFNTQTFKLEVVTIGDSGVTEADIAVHDETNRTLATMLAAMEPPTFPVAVGVIYCDPAPTYEGAVMAQAERPRRASKARPAT